MPQYLYRCPECGKDVSLNHGMDAVLDFKCMDCHTEMHRVPQMFRVCWGGLKPSDGEQSKAVQEWLSDIPRLKDEFAEKKEKHVNRTAIHT